VNFGPCWGGQVLSIVPQRLGAPHLRMPGVVETPEGRKRLSWIFSSYRQVAVYEPGKKVRLHPPVPKWLKPLLPV
jgi:hypothetical protein